MVARLHRRPRRGALSTGLALALACGGAEDETCEIATADMSAVAVVVDSGLDIRAAIDFELGDRRGRGAPLGLCDSDRLTINGQSPTAIDKASRIEYAVTFMSDAERRLEFVLDRQDQDERISFAIDLPPAFEILTPMDDDALQIGQAQLIEWEPPVGDDSTMQIGLTEALGGGQCLTASAGAPSPYEERGGLSVPDTGQWTIEPGQLESQSPAACAATYTLTRLTLGDYPTQLERGGRLEARVERYRDIDVLP